MPKGYSMTDIENWKFKDVELPKEWAEHLGNLHEGFRMLIEGPSGHGKTEYLIKLLKVLAQTYGKVSLNNVEQGKSATIQEDAKRNKMTEVKGKVILCPKEYRTFDPWFKHLQGKNKGKIIALDSLDYMKLTIDQFKQLHERFKHKAIIIVCWNDPMDINAKKIKYMCDIKVEVKDYKAQIRSRFGGNKTLVIWDKKSKSNGQIAIPELQ